MASSRNREPRARSVDWGKQGRQNILWTDRVIWGLIAANVVVFIAWQRPETIRFVAEHFRVSLESFENLRLWTLVTSAFSHRDVGHFAFNMFALYVFGRPIGQVRGAREVLEVYLSGAVVASLGHVAFSAFTGITAPALGASGAVMALAAYFGAMFPDRTMLLGFFLPMPAAVVVSIYILIDIFGLGNANSTVGHAAHLGGAVYGLLYYQFGVARRAGR